MQILVHQVDGTPVRFICLQSEVQKGLQYCTIQICFSRLFSSFLISLFFLYHFFPISPTQKRFSIYVLLLCHHFLWWKVDSTITFLSSKHNISSKPKKKKGSILDPSKFHLCGLKTHGNQTIFFVCILQYSSKFKQSSSYFHSESSLKTQGPQLSVWKRATF